MTARWLPRSVSAPPRTSMTPHMRLKHDTCSAGKRRRKLAVAGLFGWEAAGIAHRQVCASGHTGSSCGTASFWNPLLGGVVSNSLSPLVGRRLGRWATFLVSREQGSNPSEPASEKVVTLCIPPLALSLSVFVCSMRTCDGSLSCGIPTYLPRCSS